jgi:beta-glucosidase
LVAEHWKKKVPLSSSPTRHRFMVRNTGSIAGSEIAQLYISWPSHSALSHPPFTLKAFSKILSEAGASRSVELRFAVSSWSENSEKWVVENGSYTICIGTSSQDLPLNATMTIRLGFEWIGLLEKSCIKNCVVVDIQL